MKNLFIAFLLCFIFSCSSKEKEIPENIINEKELTSILADLHLSQQELNTKIESDKTNVTQDDYVEFVLQKHKISRDKFLSSLKYYSKNPVLLNGIYDSVIVKLNKNELQ